MKFLVLMFVSGPSGSDKNCFLSSRLTQQLPVAPQNKIAIDFKQLSNFVNDKNFLFIVCLIVFDVTSEKILTKTIYLKKLQQAKSKIFLQSKSNKECFKKSTIK